MGTDLGLLPGAIPVRDASNGGAGGQARWHTPYEISLANGLGIHVRANPANGTPVAYRGDCWIFLEDADVNAANWRADRNILGLQGQMPVRTGVVLSTGTAQWPDGGLAVYLPNGLYPVGEQSSEIKVSTAQLQAAEGDLQPWNIANTANIYGIQGSALVGANFAEGTTTCGQALGNYVLNISGLGFQPTFVTGRIIGRQANESPAFFADFVERRLYVANMNQPNQWVPNWIDISPGNPYGYTWSSSGFYIGVAGGQGYGGSVTVAWSAIKKA